MASEPGEEPQLIDLLHLGRAQVIGSWRVGDIVVDPGPASCLEQLLPVLEEHPPRVIALTHIHLDHAGATGSLLRRFPDAEVWVHERGARHMADPARLLASATRLYGENMDRLWGEFLPVPEDRLRILTGGESLGPMEVAYTPGHASHHVSYLHVPSNWAFTGDVGGVRIARGRRLHRRLRRTSTSPHGGRRWSCSKRGAPTHLRSPISGSTGMSRASSRS